MSKKQVICSFDYTYDKEYYHLLEAWNANDCIDFSISDCTPREIQSDSVLKIKQVLSTKIGTANYMIAIIGKHSNDRHKDASEIGYRNWQVYEIVKNIEKGNGLVIVRLDDDCAVPDEAYNIGAKWVYGFDKNKINQALQELAY